MQLTLHTGVHFAEDERMLKCLLRNAEAFSARGVAVPGPGKYRGLLRDTLNAMTTGEADEHARDILLDAILDDNTAKRLILSDANFFRIPSFAMVDGVLYPSAPTRMARMAQLFARDKIEIFMAIRNPAAFLPVLYGKAQQPERFWGNKLPQEVLWSDMITALRAAVPDIPITIWCNEDAPMMWAQIIREMAGLPENEKIIGGFDLLSSIMSPQGMAQFRAHLKEHPNLSEAQKREVMERFLEKHVLLDKVEQEVDMPGWTHELVHQLTEIYEDDLYEIQQIPNLRFIEP